jgi:hypothetical protein
MDTEGLDAPHDWENPYLSDEHREKITPTSRKRSHVKKRRAPSIKRKKAKRKKRRSRVGRR